MESRPDGSEGTGVRLGSEGGVRTTPPRALLTHESYDTMVFVVVSILPRDCLPSIPLG